ncbi:hypothetical protein QE412_002215 [Microbacterium trichothecenolyticum]|uniref:Uncharacterized protein n=1 Tax=Microbacterium trichothecenolyticum TaxID=69370 RepID=A0ABU0TVE8_MICTR|nr:hypothetical protein [Microbacterium trichothecenolyticum]
MTPGNTVTTSAVMAATATISRTGIWIIHPAYKLFQGRTSARTVAAMPMSTPPGTSGRVKDAGWMMTITTTT